MHVKELLSDDDAVSPVIGVILMVAITVILAAVIASFVLGLGNQAQNTQPQASFSFAYDEGAEDDGDGQLTVTHDSGDTIAVKELFVRGSGFETKSNINSGSDDFSTIHQSSAGTWEGQVSGADSEVVAGDFVYVGVTSDYEIDIVFQALEGDSSATLSSDDGPDA